MDNQKQPVAYTVLVARMGFGLLALFMMLGVLSRQVAAAYMAIIVAVVWVQLQMLLEGLDAWREFLARRAAAQPPPKKRGDDDDRRGPPPPPVPV